MRITAMWGADESNIVADGVLLTTVPYSQRAAWLNGIDGVWRQLLRWHVDAREDNLCAS